MRNGQLSFLPQAERPQNEALPSDIPVYRIGFLVPSSETDRRLISSAQASSTTDASPASCLRVRILIGGYTSCQGDPDAVLLAEWDRTTNMRAASQPGQDMA